MWDQLREQLRKAGLQHAVEEELRTGVALHERRAIEEQQRLAKFNRANPRRGIDGLGQTTMSMHPFFRALADVQFGKGWQKDKATRRKLVQKHPEFAVPYEKKSTVTVLKP